MRIIIDCDCTVADFVGQVCREVGELDRNQANRWDWFLEDYNKETVSAIKTKMTTVEWWDKLPVITNSTRGIAWLRGQGHKLVWVTVPFRHCEGWYTARVRWLNRNFGIDRHDEPVVTISNSEKFLISADAIIDDVPEIVDNYGVHHPEAICLTFKSEMNRNLNRELVDWNKIMSMREFWYGTHYKKDP